MNQILTFLYSSAIGISHFGIQENYCIGYDYDGVMW